MNLTSFKGKYEICSSSKRMWNLKLFSIVGSPLCPTTFFTKCSSESDLAKSTASWSEETPLKSLMSFA